MVVTPSHRCGVAHVITLPVEKQRLRGTLEEYDISLDADGCWTRQCCCWIEVVGLAVPGTCNFHFLLVAHHLTLQGMLVFVKAETEMLMPILQGVANIYDSKRSAYM